MGTDLVVGYVKGVELLYLTEPGVHPRAKDWDRPAAVLDVGWNLFMHKQEVPLDTPLIMGTEIEG